METGIFVQVRLGSTRLPRKALLPLAGAPLIVHVMRSLAAVPAPVRALLTDGQSAEDLRSPARVEGWELFVGDPEDVLRRYCDACRHFGVLRVVRATGDNPLTSGALAALILALHAEAGADLSHFLDIPWGMGVEAVEAAALFEAERRAVLPDEREHCTTYLYRHPERFRINEPRPPREARCPEARVTVDTEDDYRRVNALFTELYRGAPLEAAQVIARIRGERGRAADG